VGLGLLSSEEKHKTMYLSLRQQLHFNDGAVSGICRPTLNKLSPRIDQELMEGGGVLMRRCAVIFFGLCGRSVGRSVGRCVRYFLLSKKTLGRFSGWLRVQKTLGQFFPSFARFARTKTLGRESAFGRELAGSGRKLLMKRRSLLRRRKAL
jgi:hypothetical protein